MDLRKDLSLRQADKCGELNFGVEYDFISETLKLRVIQVREGIKITQTLALWVCMFLFVP